MKRLGSRVNLIPVIAKADTLTPNDLAKFKEKVVACIMYMTIVCTNWTIIKKKVRQVIQENNINVYACEIDSDDEDTTIRNKSINDASPYSIISSTNTVTTADGRQVRGREYFWGIAEVENDNHCDFKKLRNLLIRTHMLDLITTTEELHYEHYRQKEMATRKFGESKLKKSENPKLIHKEEDLRKSFTEKVRNEEARFRQWEQQLINERDRLNKDLETQHAHIKMLEAELDNLYRSGSTIRR
jgi:cell division control protein 12